jgi:hypothetical protein
MVGQEPRRPGGLGRQGLEVVDRGAEGLGVPGQVEEDEVVRQVQLVAGVEVAHHPMEVQQVDLAHDYPVRVLVDDPPDPAHAVVDGVPVLVVAAGGLGVVAQQRVLGDLVHHVDAEAVHPAVQPEAQHLVHGRLDRGVVPVEVGLLGRE